MRVQVAPSALSELSECAISIGLGASLPPARNLNLLLGLTTFLEVLERHVHVLAFSVEAEGQVSGAV